MPDRDPLPTIRVKPYDYQPSKAELEKLGRINAAPDELCRSAMRPPESSRSWRQVGDGDPKEL